MKVEMVSIGITSYECCELVFSMHEVLVDALITIMAVLSHNVITLLHFEVPDASPHGNSCKEELKF